MISSMTAFGRTEESISNGHVIWEMRSVNHRYLEINLRLPEDFRQLEGKVRQIIGEKLKRGKVDCMLRFEQNTAEDSELNINQGLANKIVHACAEITNLSDSQFNPLNPIDILRWPGVVESEAMDKDSIGEEILQLLHSTLAKSVESRQSEGAKLKDMIDERCEKAAVIVNDFKQQSAGLSQQLKEKLLARVQELCEEVDNERLEQELAFLAQKYDVEEELDRLGAHISEVQKIMTKSGPVGRKLDFLMQEMNREANTLGSKATDIAYTNASVELKVLIEQMREQIQNIE